MTNDERLSALGDTPGSDVCGCTRVMIGLVDPQRVLLDEIADPRMKRDDVAATYALALNTREDVDWPTVNKAIMERWSISALRYIKDRAWRIRA